MLSIGARQAKAEYMRKWRAEHKDKVQAARDRYWERKAQELDADDPAPDESQEQPE